MIGWARWGLALAVVGIGIGLVATSRWSLQAQERGARNSSRSKEAPAPRSAGVSVQEAMFRPIDLPFGEETTLEAVRQHLARVLNAQVVLDRGALDRLELTPEDTVQLDLKNVRLKVGLRLLLDQVGLSYRVEAEDNLLILTDPESSDDPARRITAELKSLHGDVHDLQDAVDDLRDLVEEELGYEPEDSGYRSMIVGRARPDRPRPPRRTDPDRPGKRSPVARSPRAGVAG